MKAFLFPHTNETPCLHPRDIASLITARFPDSRADWVRANAKLQEEMIRLELMGAPGPILAGHSNLLNNTVYIEVFFQDDRELGIQFFAYIDSALELSTTRNIESGEEGNRLQELINEIAECLNYAVEYIAT